MFPFSRDDKSLKLSREVSEGFLCSQLGDSSSPSSSSHNALHNQVSRKKKKKVKLRTSAAGTRNISLPPEDVTSEVKLCEDEMLTA